MLLEPVNISRSSVKENEADTEIIIKNWLKCAADHQGRRHRRLEEKQGI